ncbi:MAG: hypothetical protein KDB48_05270 [Solirubrobacterales bacterium]|nr:hypothetical protein [Solirubrobacterales bacterium]HMT06311.1 hypothetical protein [Solirubrobacterales bacterium]
MFDDFPDSPDNDEIDPIFEAGFLCAPLVTHPSNWINRRVETVEMLSHEETRRRVSVDFTLPANREEWPETPEGVAVPISVLTKQRRRNFDLRDASGSALPVLGRRQNSMMTHAALFASALSAIDSDRLSDDHVGLLAEQLWGVVTEPAISAFEVAGALMEAAHSDQGWLQPLFDDNAFLELFSSIAGGYILFAVIPSPEMRRHIVKFSYGDDFDFSDRLREPRWHLHGLLDWIRTPDGQRFIIDNEVSHWAESFHLEIAIPEELRIRAAVLFEETEAGPESVGDPELNVDRASLYAPAGHDANVDAALVELIPERSGQIVQRFSIGLLVTATLLLGSFVGFDQGTSDAAVSILLVGAALFSGVSASAGRHILVTKVFTGARKATMLVAIAAVIGALSLTLDLSAATRSNIWLAGGTLALMATARLALATIRAAR